MLKRDTEISAGLQKKAAETACQPVYVGNIKEHGKTTAIWKVQNSRDHQQIYMIRMSLDDNTSGLCLSFQFECNCPAAVAKMPCYHAICARKEAEKNAHAFFLMFTDDLHPSDPMQHNFDFYNRIKLELAEFQKNRQNRRL